MDRWNLGILLALTGVSFLSIRIMAHRPMEGRRSWLYLSIGTLLLCLAVCKISSTYFSGVLPLGISFFTFQLIGSLIDVSRGTLVGSFSFSQYFASIGFFPSVTAGPILRTQDFLPQLQETRSWNSEKWKWGFLLIANGLFKKKIADLLWLTTQNHLQPEMGAASAWIGVLALSAQFYADFSGYSDIAIGSAELLGFSIPENFHLPYLATSVAEHWRRWHISLYEWFRHYVFSAFLVLFWHDQKGWVRKIGPMIYSALAITATMALIGIWHAPTLGLLLWGILNGLLVAASPSIANWRGGWLRNGVPAIALTFFLTAVIRVLTVMSVRESWEIWRALVWTHGSSAMDRTLMVDLLFVGSALIVPHAIDAALIRWNAWWRRSPLAWGLAALLLAFVFVIGVRGRIFLYQQF